MYKRQRARGVAPGGLASGPGADAWRRAHGRDTYETHARRWDHGATYGPIVTIRGERHSGTNWLRVMVDKNCDVPHHGIVVEQRRRLGLGGLPHACSYANLGAALSCRAVSSPIALAHCASPGEERLT